AVSHHQAADGLRIRDNGAGAIGRELEGLDGVVWRSRNQHFYGSPDSRRKRLGDNFAIRSLRGESNKNNGMPVGCEARAHAIAPNWTLAPFGMRNTANGAGRPVRFGTL